MHEVTIEYLHNGYHSFVVTRGNIRAVGDRYPKTKRGLKEMKRDAAAIVQNLRKGNNIKVKR